MQTFTSSSTLPRINASRSATTAGEAAAIVRYQRREVDRRIDVRRPNAVYFRGDRDRVRPVIVERAPVVYKHQLDARPELQRTSRSRCL